LRTLIEFDYWLFHFINGIISNPFFDWLMPIITNENNVAIPLILAWFWMLIFCGRRGKIAAIILLATLAFTDVIAAQIIKPYFERLRPSRSMIDGINLLVPRGGKYGFVSNHAANTMSAAIIILYFYRRWGYWAIAISILVGFSRIYVGVHYPADVLGGWFFGCFTALIFITIWVFIKVRERKRGKNWVNYS
jgi:undecaprenyl-diphosphatase